MEIQIPVLASHAMAIKRAVYVTVPENAQPVEGMGIFKEETQWAM